jgi:hypothetical protein
MAKLALDMAAAAAAAGGATTTAVEAPVAGEHQWQNKQAADVEAVPK